MRFWLGGWLFVGSGCGPLLSGDPTESDGASQTDAMPSTSAPSTAADATSTGSPDDSSTGSDDDSTGCSTACDDSGQDTHAYVFPTCDAGGFSICGSPALECDPWAQDCPAGEKCQPWANDGGADWNATRCAPIDPSAGQPGDPCLVEGSAVSGADSCALGSMCWHVDPDTNEGTCVAFCMGTRDLPVCDDPQRTCAMTNDGTLSVCLPTCDPLLGDCPDGEGCYPIAGDATLAMFVCAPTGNGIETADGHATHCAAGTIAIDHDELSSCARDVEPCCAAVCSLEAPTCAEGLTCTPFYEDGELPPDLADIGVCLG